RTPIVGRQVVEVVAVVATLENVIEPAQHVVLHRPREAVEARRIDEVAARILEQALLQVELAQRPPSRIARPTPAELVGEPGRPAHRRDQWSLAAEKQVSEKLIAGILDAPQR